MRLSGHAFTHSLRVCTLPSSSRSRIRVQNVDMREPVGKVTGPLATVQQFPSRTFRGKVAPSFQSEQTLLSPASASNTPSAKPQFLLPRSLHLMPPSIAWQHFDRAELTQLQQRVERQQPLRQQHVQVALGVRREEEIERGGSEDFAKHGRALRRTTFATRQSHPDAEDGTPPSNK